jgi:hypothetical protein
MMQLARFTLKSASRQTSVQCHRERKGLAASMIEINRGVVTLSNTSCYSPVYGVKEKAAQSLVLNGSKNFPEHDEQ